MLIVGVLLFLNIQLMVVAAFTHQAFATGGAFVVATRFSLFVGIGLLAMHADAWLVAVIEFHGHGSMGFDPGDEGRPIDNRCNEEWPLHKYSVLSTRYSGTRNRRYENDHHQ